jgi:hypothetical protein
LLVTVASNADSAWPQDFVLSKQEAHRTVIEVTSIDLERSYEESSFTGKDGDGNRHVFLFLPKTKVRRLILEDSTTDLAELLRESGTFPLVVEQEVLVTWKLHDARNQKIVVQLTIFE